jgi:alcohol dehydrogenase
MMSIPQPFEFRAATRLVVGPGAVDRLGTLAREFGGNRALVVSDSGVVKAGHAGLGIAALESAGYAVATFTDVGENPTTAHVAAGVEVARRVRPDVIVAIGGGSSMDCAKGINFVHSCGGRMHDYHGRGKATGPMLPSIGVPTTAGTGSETQSFALISDAETHVKMACGDPRAAFRVAILDVRLTLTQPPRVTALTGIDALSHAVESHVSRAATPASRLFSREAFRLLAAGLPRVFADPGDVAAREAVQLGASWAGMAIENSMLGAAHALANPLTAVHDVVHGQAVGMMLPHVVRFNAAGDDSPYADLVAALPDGAKAEGHRAGDRLATWLEGVVVAGGLAPSLSAAGIAAPDLGFLAAAAASQWTAGFNPRAVAVEDLTKLYEEAR